LAPRNPSVGRLVGAEGQILDRVVATCYRAPRSYTGEDVVEISCHGNPVVVQAILERTMQCGARLAEPGEFSLRAFLNGKMDLAQSEGLRDLIAAQTFRQAEAAQRQLEGALSVRLAPAKKRLIDTVVQLETAVEFVEEEVSPRGRESLVAELRQVTREMQQMIAAYGRGQRVREGWSVALAGRTNVGKSSIFNRLLKEERAIVTEIPGTTRDPLRETIDLEGIPITFIDTAGLRQPRGIVEHEGIRRSHTVMADAHAVILVLDAQRGWTPGDRRILHQIQNRRVIAVWNKIDLVGQGQAGNRKEKRIPALSGLPCCRISAVTGAGMADLHQLILRSALPDGLSDEDLLVTNVRHKDCLERTCEAIEKACNALSGGLSEEFAVADLRNALAALGEITGDTAIEDILRSIFSQFCIGK
jgi:tRNA modification GTPase